MSQKLNLKLGYDTSALVIYKDEVGIPLVLKALFGNKTAEYFAAQTEEGRKGIQKINLLDIDVDLRARVGCAMTSSGDLDFTQKEINVKSFYDQKDFCYATLESYYTREFLAKGQSQQTMPLEDVFLPLYMGKIAQAMEARLWTETSMFQGLNASIDASTPINGNPTGITVATGITLANVIGIFTGMVSLLPEPLNGEEDVEFVCGWDTYKLLLQAYFNLNNYGFSTAEASPYRTGSFDIPAFGLKVTAFKGLSGTKRIHLLRKSNVLIGTDITNEIENNIQIWYEQKENLFYARTMGALGTAIKVDGEVVTFKLVP